MKKFETINEWLNTNPSAEETEKVLNLIHKGEARRLRIELYKKSAYLKKLQRTVILLEKVNIKAPADLLTSIKSTKQEIEHIKKQIPVNAPKPNKSKDME